MSSLKEVKNRISSVKSTRQITSAMKMVASAKLHKAQGRIGNMLPYQRKLNEILTNFLRTDASFESPYTEKRPVTRVAVVAFSSNSSLCGAFNSNVAKMLERTLEDYQSLGKENILIYPVGRKVEEAVKAQLEGKPAEAQEEKKRVPVEGFQVVSADMFSHALDPVVRFSKNQIAFNSTCISRLNRIAQSGTSLSLNRTQYVELLFNPVERMLAIRPCAEDNPNAICWATESGKSRMVSASAFCRILFSILDWDSEYTYRVPCIVRSRGDETILFFDLDNFIGSAKKSRDENLEEEVAAAEEAIREESEETRGIFFSADDEEEPQEIEDTTRMATSVASSRTSLMRRLAI